MDAAARYTAQQSTAESPLVLEVATDNATARAFYEWAGFEPAGTGEIGYVRLARRATPEAGFANKSVVNSFC